MQNFGLSLDMGTKCQRHEPGSLIRPQECTRNAGLCWLYQAARSAHSVVHKASLHSRPSLELTHLTSLCQRTTQRPHTGALIDDGTCTGARAPRLCQKESRQRSQLQPGRRAGKSAPFLQHVSWNDVRRLLCSAHRQHGCTYELRMLGALKIRPVFHPRHYQNWRSGLIQTFPHPSSALLEITVGTVPLLHEATALDSNKI